MPSDPDATASHQDGGGADASASPEGMTLTIDGVNIPVDFSKLAIESKTQSNAWITRLTVPIVNGEQYAWNTKKHEIFLVLHDEQTQAAPHPLGSTDCDRGNDLATNYGQLSTRVEQYTESGTEVLGADLGKTCSTTFVAWQNGARYQGSATGTFSKGLPFTVTWNVTKK